MSGSASGGGLAAFILKYSLPLIVGALLGLVWANLSPGSYHHLIEYPLASGVGLGALHEGHRVLTLHFLINDILMAFFFAIAGKEVWEAIILRHGALRGRKALTPLIATAGGVLGPVVVYLIGASLIGQTEGLGRGWAIPTATDIAFSYMIGRVVFGARHPAVAFLLLLAIADDGIGLAILAVFYPQGDLAPAWLLASLAAAFAAWLIFNRAPRMLGPDHPWTRRALAMGFWPYLVFGAVCWFGFQQAGIHPALGLLPMIPAMPHEDVDFGVYAPEEDAQKDALNQFAHFFKPSIDWVVLFLFGLANAGVELSAIGAPTWLVLFGLMIGKPVGIMLFGWIAARILGFGLPEGMRMTDLPVLGCVAAIGFTVALFVAGVAFEPGPLQDAAKMGALLSLASAALAIAAGRIFGVQKREEAD